MGLASSEGTRDSVAEDDLLASLRAGDPEAFAMLMRNNNQRLFRLARGFLKDDVEAEEVVQDSYVRAFTHLDGFRGGSSLATWLARIDLANTLTAVDGPFITAEPTPEQVIARREIRSAVEKAVDELPPPFRSVFVLRVIEQMSTEETASWLGIAGETVKTRLHRANKLLRKALSVRFETIFDDLYLFRGTRCDGLVQKVLQRIGVTETTVVRCDRPAPCRSPP